MFFVWVSKMFPSWRCVRASTLGGGLKLKTACKHCIHNFMLGGLDVLKFSAKPNNDRYQASCEDAILTFLIQRYSFLLHHGLPRTHGMDYQKSHIWCHGLEDETATIGGVSGYVINCQWRRKQNELREILTTLNDSVITLSACACCGWWQQAGIINGWYTFVSEKP